MTPAGSLDNLVAAIEGTGRSAWLVVEAWEQPDFAARHGRSAFGSLDWPPAALINSAVRVQVFKLEDRDRFRAGGEVRTDYVAEPARR